MPGDMVLIDPMFFYNVMFVLLLVFGIGRIIGRPDIRLVFLSLLFVADFFVMLWFHSGFATVIYCAVVACLAVVALPGCQTQTISQSLGRLKFPLYLLSVFTISTLVYVHLPITTFLTSPGEIGIHIDYLLTTNLRDAMLVVYVAAVLYAFAISQRMRSVLTVIGVTSLILTIVYAFLLPMGYPVMNGVRFEQIPIPELEMAGRVVIDTVVIALSTLLTVYLMKAHVKGLLVGIFLFIVSLSIVTWLNISADRSTQITTGTNLEPGGGEQQPLKFSKGDNNVLIVFLDRFMGGFVEDILRDEPQLLTRLDGFTWYPLSISAGDNSIAGVHPILGGYDYTPLEMNARDLLLRDVSAESFAILPLNFIAHGYQANVVNPHGLGFSMNGDCSYLDFDGVNCTHVPLTVTKELAERMGVPLAILSKSNYGDLLVLLSSMRASPYSMKAVLSARGPWRPFMDHSAGATFRQWAELKSLPMLTATDSDRSNYNQIFNILPHEPYFLGEDCNPADQAIKYSAEQIRDLGYKSLFAYQHAIAARCSLLLVSDYFEWMKEAGIYDNTKIVIVSDHGIVGTVLDNSSRAKRGGTTENQFVQSRSVLFVKEHNAQGALDISEQFMPNAEVPGIVCQEIGGCVNPFLENKIIEAYGRDDPFIVTKVPWQFNRQEPKAFRIYKKYEVSNRDPYKLENWKEVK